jgi:DNA processing protein
MLFILNTVKYINALNRINGVGPQKMQRLLSFFPTPENAWKSDFQNLLASGIGEKLAEKIITERNTINPEEEWERLEKENIQLLLLTDPAYPRLLKEIPNPPYVLYIKGELDFNSRPMISVVGSRKYSEYGSRTVEGLVRDLTKAGITIVSGMALGIDALAHRATLENGGKTVAVLGSGLDRENIYPKNNFNLSCEICQNGALISDYPIGTPAGVGTFPARNRLIAGMSLGTLIVEAGEKSGSLITAGLALEFNREVFAVPGPIYSPQSFGANKLIQSGAKLIISANDILEEIGMREERQEKKEISPEETNPEEKILLKILTHVPLHIDNLARLSKLETRLISSTLSMMEIKGWVKNVGGQNYVIT